MEKLIKPGRIIYAVGIIGLGVLCILSKDFIFGRPPAAKWAASIPGKLVWAYVSGSLVIVCGLAIIFQIKARSAAILVGLMILVISFLARHLYEMTDWVGAYKALALGGGSFIIGVSLPANGGATSSRASVNDQLVFTGCLFFSLFFIICGFAHFKFADFIIKDFMPSYLPFPAFWTYFCGICLLAGGVGLLIPQTKKWAALLSGIMIAGWFVLLHIVRFAADTSNTSDRLVFASHLLSQGSYLCWPDYYRRNSKYHKPMQMEIDIVFRIILEKPPAGVDFGLQKGKGSNYETIQKKRSNTSDLNFEFTARVKSEKNSMADFFGPFVQGPRDGRFVYIDIGSCAGQTNTPWSRRLKIPLRGITPEVINTQLKDSTMILETRVPGTGKDGGPNCATVKPFGGWKPAKR